MSAQPDMPPTPRRVSHLDPRGRLHGFERYLGLARHLRRSVVLAAVALYLLAYLGLRPSLGHTAAVFSFLPVATASVLYGLKGGLLAGALGILSNAALLYLFAPGEFRATVWPGSLPGSVALLVGAALVGVLSDLVRILDARRATREQAFLTSALGEVASALNTTLELEDALERLLVNLRPVVPYEHASLLRVEEEVAAVLCSRGPEGGTAGERPAPGGPVPLAGATVSEVPLIAAMVDRGEPLCLPNARQAAGWRDLPGGDRVRSYLGAPVQVGGQTVGLLQLASEAPGAFRPDQIPRLQAFASQAAILFQNARLLAAERSHSARLRRANALFLALGRVTARMETAPDLDSVLTVLGSELRQIGIHSLVALQEPEQVGLNIRYLSLAPEAVALAEKITGVSTEDYHLTAERIPHFEQVIGQGQPVFAADLQLPEDLPPPFDVLPRRHVQRFRDLIEVGPQTRWILLPLVREEQVLGTLWLWGPELVAADLPAANLFASQVAVALENTRLYARVQQLAITDELTGLYNRRGLYELGRREVARARRFGTDLSALMIDIDHFKRVNDRWGHSVGDEVLCALAGRLQGLVRSVDVVARYGGEEFVILLPGARLRWATKVAQRVLAAVNGASFSVGETPVAVTISIGVAAFGREIEDLAGLIHRADLALYRAKERGRQRVYVVEGSHLDAGGAEGR